MKVKDLYDVLKSIEDLETLRRSLLTPYILASKFIGKDAADYIVKHNDIPITEESSDEDKKLHSQLLEIDVEIKKLKNIEIS